MEQKTKINWKVRFKNKIWLTSFISLIIGFVFNVLKMFDVVPKVTENMVMEIVGQFLTFLGLFGVIVDPTTAGLYDSQRALNYDEPWDDNIDGAEEASEIEPEEDPNGEAEN